MEDPNEKKPEYWDDREFLIEANYDKGVDELVKNENYNGVWKPQMIDNRESSCMGLKGLDESATDPHGPHST